MEGGTRERSPWRGAGSRAAVLALALAGTAMGLTGCHGDGRADGTTPAAATGSADYGATFLARGECGAQRRTAFTEVPCTSERATARVLARYEGTPDSGTHCPERTDFVLHISGARPDADEDGDGTAPEGYACMRALEPPHPGDPGAGGGPRTVVGDCVYGARRGEVRETACDGSGARPPEFRLVAAVARRADCPPGTALYVHLDGELPVGCAVRSRPLSGSDGPEG
ncbi:hypothetical protein LRS74_21995 [Streptomyces sp. LX-29]|uniref:hypothetical protein n=1 Tax=Streptomyces sp. LX-29 TaxID=2900152 RepID=UPI00240DBF94|nr:hypothetical protein [Streptomyces sp. LX-29]WFB09416.1 hypothetical protein LRS74_21995 [Streptomyces sp. LX-29]